MSKCSKDLLRDSKDIFKNSKEILPDPKEKTEDLKEKQINEKCTVGNQTFETLSEEIYVSQYAIDDGSFKATANVLPKISHKEINSPTPFVATAYLYMFFFLLFFNFFFNCVYFRNVPKSTLDITLADGLKEVLEFSNRLQESERYITQIISKFIKNDCLEKQLSELRNFKVNIYLQKIYS